MLRTTRTHDRAWTPDGRGGGEEPQAAAPGEDEAGQGCILIQPRRRAQALHHTPPGAVCHFPLTPKAAVPSHCTASSHSARARAGPARRGRPGRGQGQGLGAGLAWLPQAHPYPWTLRLSCGPWTAWDPENLQRPRRGQLLPRAAGQGRQAKGGKLRAGGALRGRRPPSPRRARGRQGQRQQQCACSAPCCAVLCEHGGC